jgi:hypothetical protein
MKRKLRKSKIKPIKGIHTFYTGEFEPDEGAQGLLETFAGMGYFVYRHPTSEYETIISDRQLTNGDVKKHAKQLDIDLEYWDDDTDLNLSLDEELEPYV